MDIIIGAGVSGMSFAMFTQNPYKILEKECEYGGYCRTIRKDGFVWDYSGHFFHFQDSNIREIVLKGILPEHLKTVQKVTKIRYKDRYIDFPFQKNIHQLPQQEFIDCLYDLFFTSDLTPAENFKDMVCHKLGKSISEKFLIPYNEKLYACDLNRLDANAMGRFFPQTTQEEVIRNFKISDNSSYNNTFVYPIGGAIEYIDSIAKHVRQNNISYLTEVYEINMKNHIAYTNLGEFHYDRLISTMPLPNLLNCCGINYDSSIYTSNKVLVFNLGFDCKGLDTQTSWIYFPEKNYAFYRIGFYDNILSTDRMSMYVEVGFAKSAELTNPEAILQNVLIDITKAGLIHDERLISYSFVVMDPAYVHVSQKSIADVSEKKRALEKFDIYSIGRYGSWTYCSIEDNIKEAHALSLKLNQ